MRLGRHLACALALSATTAAASPPARVWVEEGRRVASTGDEVRYELYVPETPPGARPTVVLTHGFARSLRFHRNNARYFAEHGLLVLIPNLDSRFAPARARNVETTADHVRWLVARGTTPGDPLEGRVDPSRIGLAGHSAGGAVSFEAALALASSETPVEALLLLDGVPYLRTRAAASALPAMDFLSLTSDPSPCNAFDAVHALEAKLDFPAESVHVLGATHCDPESPTDVLCKIACGGGSPEGQSIYRELTRLFFARAFGEGPEDAYEDALEALEHEGAVEREALGPEVAVSLRVNGQRGGELSGPERGLRITMDVFAQPTEDEATWYAGIVRERRIDWVTSRGLVRHPAAFARFRPTPLDDVVIYDGPFREDGNLRVLVIAVAGGRVVAHDRVELGGS